jgi:hypothetical protein
VQLRRPGPAAEVVGGGPESPRKQGLLLRAWRCPPPTPGHRRCVTGRGCAYHRPQALPFAFAAPCSLHSPLQRRRARAWCASSCLSFCGCQVLIHVPRGGAFLVLSYTRLALDGRSPLEGDCAVGSLPPPSASNVDLQCGADRHPSSPFALSGSSVGQRGIFAQTTQLLVPTTQTIFIS